MSSAATQKQVGIKVFWREGSLLVFENGAQLPDRCIKCNCPAEGNRLRVALACSDYGPPFGRKVIQQLPYIRVLYNLLYFCTRRTAAVSVGMCPRCRAKRRRFLYVCLSLITVGAALFGTFAYLSDQHFLARDTAGPFVLAGLVLAVPSFFVLCLRLAPVKAEEIDGDLVAVSGACPRYLDTLLDNRD